MSTSSDGIHFWGACWYGDDREPYWPWSHEPDDEGYWEPRDDEEVAENWLSRATGGPVKPDGKFGPDAYREFVKARDEHLAAYFGSALHFGWHCSYDCPMEYVAIAGTHIVANRGSPERLEPHGEPSPAWRLALTKLADVTGRQIDDDHIGWWLTSMYG